MCGIAGIFNFNGKPVELDILQKMTNSLAHRGPDGDGHWISSNQKVGFGHRRLSIIDLSDNASQPMHSSNGDLTITFNGEIYNYIELREILRSKGFTFHTASDTEVILNAYICWGIKCLEKFDGMFAFAIWDNKKQEMFIARDRFGEKPLHYYYNKETGFCFASEMKALFAAGIPCSVEGLMMYYFLAFDVVENPYNKQQTFYKDIFRLPPASFLLIKANGDLKLEKYWEIHQANMGQSTMVFEEACDRFTELLNRSVERRLRSDVEVGSSLSGGLDSSTIVLCIENIKKMQKSSMAQKSFTALFPGTDVDENRYLQEVLKGRQISSYTTEPNFTTLISELDKISYHQEEPFSTTSIFAQWEVKKLAKANNIKVLLDGQGSDEYLAGYSHYFAPFFRELLHKNPATFFVQRDIYKNIYGTEYPISSRFLGDTFFEGAIRTIGTLRRKHTVPLYLKTLHPDFVNQYRDEEPPFAIYQTLNEQLHFSMFTEGLHKLLRFCDRNSMAHGVEVRLPFLSHELVEFAFTLPASFKIWNGYTKFLLRNSYSDILPQAIKDRKLKIGFNTPENEWFATKEFNDLLHTSSASLADQGFLAKTTADEVGWKNISAAQFVDTSKRFTIV